MPESGQPVSKDPPQGVAAPASDQEEQHYRILQLLNAQPATSQREIAAEVKISIGAVNYCMRALVEKGWIKVSNFRAANNRLRYAYVLTPKGIYEKSRLTSAFLQRKLVEYERIKSEIRMLEVEVQTQGSPCPTTATGPGAAMTEPLPLCTNDPEREDP